MTWDAHDVRQALEELRVPNGAVLVTHANIALCGRPRSRSASQEMLRGLASDDATTLVLPAFTYSLSSGAIFDARDEPGSMGALSVEAHRRGDFLRSQDPMFSMLARGPIASRLFADIPNRSFGYDSVFDRLIHQQTWLVSINLDAGSTLAHQVEYEEQVPHRYEKVFAGQVRLEDTLAAITWTSYVRDLSIVGTRQSFARLTKDLIEEGLFTRCRLGRGTIGAIDIARYRVFIKERLRKESNYLTEAGLDWFGESRQSR